MCQIEEVILACGHKQYRLKYTCSEAKFNRGSDVSGPPDFCTAGVQILRTSKKVDDICGATCKYARARESATNKYKNAFNIFVEHQKRIDLIKKALPSTPKHVALMYDFRSLESKGWDPVRMEEMCQDSLAETRKLLVNWAQYKKKALRDLGAGHDKAKADMESYSIVDLDGKTSELVSVDFGPFRKLCQSIETTVPEKVKDIEIQASFACLEKLGWKLPTTTEEDQEHAALIAQLGKWKKGEMSGTRMDDAKVWPEGVDPLEVADDEEGTPEWWAARIANRSRQWSDQNKQTESSEYILEKMPESPETLKGIPPTPQKSAFKSPHPGEATEAQTKKP